ncbi:DNA-binding protein (histone) [Bordetella ansorpii]|uniref:DNA-binding protein (Histone) n=1 Tax=Bordetella ansorpii TaxID=288768 RepID=A0A157QPL4_9BORD|nr:H-NS histone family protein [Bordetella ansorpii]SAI46959.1 DNA-binding protein (histone) [Bordetella ansorpii]
MRQENLKTIEAQIRKLEREKEKLRLRRRKPVIASIVKSMQEYGVTPQELQEALARTANKRGSRAQLRKSGATPGTKPRAAVAAKYRHPDSGASWSGRGKAPRWLVEAETQGQRREEFLITP